MPLSKRRRNSNASQTPVRKRARGAQTRSADNHADETSDETYKGKNSALNGRVAVKAFVAANLGVLNDAGNANRSTNTRTETTDDEDDVGRVEKIMFAEREIDEQECSENVDDDGAPRVDYLLAANPKGKARAVGAPKRNRKEQMSVHEQIRAGKDLARALGVVRCGDAPSAPENSDDNSENTTGDDDNEKRCFSPPPPPPSDTCVDGHSSSDTAQKSARVGGNRKGKKYPFLRSLRAEEQARKSFCNLTSDYVPLRVNKDDKDDKDDKGDKDDKVDKDDKGDKGDKDDKVDKDDKADKADKDEKKFDAAAVVRTTNSDQLRPNDYSVYDATQPYEDEAYEEFASDASALSDAAVREYAARIAGANAFTVEERLDMARAAFDRCGYGRAAITMEDFDVTRAAALAKHDDGEPRAHDACCYPISSNLRCRYDHHRFGGIPILLPLHYHAEKNILEVLPDAVFCSFACAVAHVQREAPRLHHDVRNDRVSLLRFMARKWFGITERIRPAPMLQQQREYGGRLTIEQFRALSHTHHSFVEYPLAAAVPARYVTEIIVARRMDRAKRQGLRLRVAEQHSEQVPEAPAALDIDPSAPAAPRGAEARARAARAKEARAKKLGAAGIELPNKKRTVTTESGERQTIDRAYVEQVIRKTAEQQKSKPKRRHALQHIMSVKKVSPTLKKK